MKVCVVGTGTMGNGIAQTFAQAGHDVLLKGRSEASLQRAHKNISKSLGRMVSKGKMDEETQKAIEARIVDTMDFNDLRDSDLIIEVVAEQMPLKKEMLENKGGFISAHWDGTVETEVAIKDATKATIRCIPMDAVEEEGKCVFSGKPSHRRVLFARSY